MKHSKRATEIANDIFNRYPDLVATYTSNNFGAVRLFDAVAAALEEAMIRTAQECERRISGMSRLGVRGGDRGADEMRTVAAGICRSVADDARKR